VVGSSHIVVKDKITGGEADVQAEDSIVKKGGRKFVDVARVLPDGLEGGRRVEKIETGETQMRVCVRKHPGQGGHDSKSFVLNRYIELDAFFFENLGLWEGEGGKAKGLYFGNNCLEILLHFLKFSEERLGLGRTMFNVTVNTPDADCPRDEIKRRWSERLGIPFENFTNTCVDTRINSEYVQVYINGIVLAELMNGMHEKMKQFLVSDGKNCTPYMRGIIAAEGQVAIKKSGTISHVAIASVNMEDVDLFKRCLATIGIASGKYMENGNKFPIYGRRNLEKVRELDMMRLHPAKKLKFENGISRFQRFVMKGSEMEELIIQQLRDGPRTYDDLALALNKSRTVIQSHYIPILEKKGVVKRVGKRKQAWMFGAA